MIVNELEPIDHPDFNDVVIHFTGRQGPSRRSTDVDRMSDWERLQAIVSGTRVLGCEMPGVRASAVCFTEATSRGCAWLVNEGRYSSCGIAFTKRFLFSVGGGPVLQVRGDEWASVASWPDNLRARAVRLWPGATATRGEVLPWWLAGRSEWLYEREWRVPAPLGGLDFLLDDVAFLVVPSVDHLRVWVSDVAPDDVDLARRIASFRYVVLGPNGIEVRNGVRERLASTALVSQETGD